MILQAPPPPPLRWEPLNPTVFRATLPVPRLQLPAPQAPSRAPRAGEATVEVVAPGLSEEVGARLQLRLELTAAARDSFRQAGWGSREGRALLGAFCALDASSIHHLGNAQTRTLQDLFNPPRVPVDWRTRHLDPRAEPPK